MRADVELPNSAHATVRAGPSFCELEASPTWVDTENQTPFREEYGAYLSHFVLRYRGKVDIYFVFEELGGRFRI